MVPTFMDRKSLNYKTMPENHSNSALGSTSQVWHDQCKNSLIIRRLRADHPGLVSRCSTATFGVRITSSTSRKKQKRTRALGLRCWHHQFWL
jgi:hypothetical protein